MNTRSFPSFLRIPVLAAFLAAVTLASVRADDPIKPDQPPARGKEVLVIKESQDAQTFNAEGQDVTINGSGNKVTIKGTCHALTISGNNNLVHVASVVSIAVSGANNQVVWRAASGGETPQVTDLGKDNRVSQSAKD